MAPADDPAVPSGERATAEDAEADALSALTAARHRLADAVSRLATAEGN
ncbi:hypothetical protein [Streptomyces sp. NPDC059862]